MKRRNVLAVGIAALALTSAAPPVSYTVLIHGGTIYDGSVKGQLRRLKEALSAS